MVKVSPLRAPAMVLVKVGLAAPYGREALLTVITSGAAAVVMVRAGFRTAMVSSHGLVVVPGGQVEPAGAEADAQTGGVN